MTAKVLIACEESQAVTIEMRALGIEAYSCDILPCSGGHPEWHIQGDVLPLLNQGWDMVIAFPPCTYLSSSGMHWTTRGFRDPQLTEDALEFVKAIMDADCPRVVVENPIGVISTKIRKPDQIIQPWMFGEDASKKTCLWLKGLPLLVSTEIIKKGRYSNQTPSGQNKLGPSAERAKLRSKTYPGIAKAMAEQWGALLLKQKEQQGELDGETTKVSCNLDPD